MSIGSVRDDWKVQFARELATNIVMLVRKASTAPRLRTQERYLVLAESKREQLRVKLADAPDAFPTSELNTIDSALASLRQDTAQRRSAHAEQLAEEQFFLAQSLHQQCNSLSIALEILELERSRQGWIFADTAFKRPEDAAFAFFSAQGYEGSSCEGGAVLSLLKCACMDFLKSIDPLGQPSNVHGYFFEGLCETHSNRASEILHEIQHAPPDIVSRNIDLMLPSAQGNLPPMNKNGLNALWLALGNEGAAKICEIFLQDPYGFRGGWPDLTIAKDGRMRFVEIKTKDKLHASQRDTISELLLPLGFEVSVLQLLQQRQL